MTDTSMIKQNEKVEKKAPAPDTAAIYAPAVDLYEDNERIVLMAEMPGVDQKSVEVTVENNVLTLEGTAQVDVPEGYDLIGQEYGVGKYRRDFKLMTALDTAGIKARVYQGVLEVTLPKREEVKTRKIEITA